MSLLNKKPYWRLDEAGMYYRMDREDFMIFRHPSSRRARKAYADYHRIYKEELDKRWNLWHHWFKRVVMYKGLKFCLNIFKVLKRWRLL